MRDRLDGLAGVDVSITAQQGGPGGGSPIHVEIFNNDLDVAATATQQIITLSKSWAALWILQILALYLVLNGPQIDRDEAARHGVSIDSIGSMVKLITRGIDISDYRPDDSDDEIDITLRFQKGQRNRRQT